MKNAVLLLSLLLFGACSSGYLVPVTYHPYAGNGMALSTELHSVHVTTENIEVKGAYMVFDMEVQNGSAIPVEIIPQHIMYYASPVAFQPVEEHTEDIHALSMFYNKTFNYKEKAMRPKEVEKYFQERIKAKASLTILLALAGAGMVIYDAAKDSEDFYKTEWTTADEKKAVTRDVLTASSLVAIDIAGESLAASARKDNEEARFLPDEIFPHTTIAPGHSYRGKIFFPKQEANKYYRLIVPIGNTDHVFDFRKTTTEEKNKVGSRQQQ